MRRFQPCPVTSPTGSGAGSSGSGTEAAASSCASRAWTSASRSASRRSAFRSPGPGRAAAVASSFSRRRNCCSRAATSPARRASARSRLATASIRVCSRRSAAGPKAATGPRRGRVRATPPAATTPAARPARPAIKRLRPGVGLVCFATCAGSSTVAVTSTVVPNRCATFCVRMTTASASICRARSRLPASTDTVSTPPVPVLAETWGGEERCSVCWTFAATRLLSASAWTAGTMRLLGGRTRTRASAR